MCQADAGIRLLRAAIPLPTGPVRTTEERVNVVAVAVSAFAIVLAGIGCRSSSPAPATSTVDASLAEASAEAGPAADGNTTPSAREALPLPSAERLVAPFRGTKAHGFVAMTNMDRRAFVPITPGDALDPARPVLVASFTKLWTAVAALRMVARGELSLDETAKDALPELASRPWAPSTLRELLTHTSLVPEFDEKAGYYRKPDVDFQAPVEVLARHVPRDWTEKRGVYKYRNSELALVGAILGARAKMPLDRVDVDDRIVHQTPYGEQQPDQRAAVEGHSERRHQEDSHGERGGQRHSFHRR